MSGQLRALKNRIRSVENTKKITRAMEMVAAAKLRRFQDMMTKARPFTQGLETLLKRVSQSKLAPKHPFLTPRKEKNIVLILMTSDAGLCGSYNNELIETARRCIAERPKEQKIEWIGVGKMGINALKKLGYSLSATFTDLRASMIEQILGELKSKIEKIYLENAVDAVYFVSSRFKTVTSYKTSVEKVLPLEKPVAEENESKVSDYIFEPSPAIIFEKLIPLFFEAKIRTLFLESIVSEQIARMTAMHQATENAKEMIDSLVLQRNKARQAAITKEIIEIVSGSRALKI